MIFSQPAALSAVVGLAALAAATGSHAQPVVFVRVADQATCEEQVAEAVAAGMPTYLYVSSEFCPSCFLHQNEVLGDPDVGRALGAFRCIRVDVEDVPFLRDLYGVRGMVLGTPTHLFFDSTGAFVYRYVGNFAGIGEPAVAPFLRVLDEVRAGRADYYQLLLRLDDPTLDLHQLVRLLRFVYDEPKLRHITSDPLYDSLIGTGTTRTIQEAAIGPVATAASPDRDLWLALAFLTERFDDRWYREFTARHEELGGLLGEEEIMDYLLGVTRTNMYDGRDLLPERVRQSTDTLRRILALPDLRELILRSPERLSTAFGILDKAEDWSAYLSLLLEGTSRGEQLTSELNYRAGRLVAAIPPGTIMRPPPDVILQDNETYTFSLSLIIAWANHHAGVAPSSETIAGLAGKIRADGDRERLEEFMAGVGLE